MLRYLFLAIIIFLLPATVSSDTSTAPTVIPLKILEHTLYTEIAHTPTARAQGLMYRSQLDGNSGMLFVFPKTNIYGMWMLNTSIPLSVAFLDEKGVILNIADMTPHSVTPHYSAKPAKYALEMNLGWFAKKDIKTGVQVRGLEQAPEAE
ncbi:DUF192 domain-containing protein [Nitrosomonas sp. Nm132]|jgi:uncharacterized membrane protein (UPF0127 family)|uniref:DUF192 domain-containing protein n=1 Tax=Nitrosomonas sp. Nm132 TaxID=1881053 RepID=UPI00087EC7F1|nr:DUF192 domain-containing protein [Nitrosomonas sp. Nm132]SDH22189.1 hypothetical protein SAMN05428952_100845 [Nitrosomonas sp. Nm132]